MARLLELLLHGDAMSFGGAGIALAAVLVIVLRLALPKRERRLMRQPLVFLALHLMVVLGRAVIPAGSPGDRLVGLTALLFLLFSIGRSVFLLVVDVLLGRRFTKPLPKIFRDILQALVYAAAVLITLRASGIDPGSLLATSALLTAVLGLSMQDTLGNLFAGLSIQAQHPFEVGDWIQFDENPKLVGKVLEINWRATRMITLDQVEVIIPNGPLAKAPIRNFTKPTPIARLSLNATVAYHVSPNRVHAILLEAAASVKGVLQEPAPSVVTADFADSGIDYQVRFFTADYGGREGILAAVRDRIWYALHRAEIEFALPRRIIDTHHIDDASRSRSDVQRLETRERALRSVDFLATLPGPSLRRLAELTRTRLYSSGELVLRQGEGGAEFFIVLCGAVSVVLGGAHQATVEIARLGPGSFFGEMSLVTGEPRTATVRTSEESQLLVIDKASFQEVLASVPEVIERISQVLAARQEQLEAASDAITRDRTKSLHERSGILLARIREFFSM